MGRRKWDPLSPEEKRLICEKCEGFCCDNFFIWVGAGDAPREFHEFRGRKVLKYGTTESVIIPDPCPHRKRTEKGWCDCYEDRPTVCQVFPTEYSPFWNLKCKLMRELYKRGQLPKNVTKFNKLVKNRKPKSVFKFFKKG
jgi:Fe-S-cluster containining protein